MSEWEKVDGTDEDYGIMPLDSETGLPDNHVVTIIERRITVDFPTLIQNNVKTDTITLDLDAEWDDVDAYLIFGWTGGTKMVEYTAPATVIPRECMEDVGTVSLSVVGYNKDRTMRLVTVYAPGIFTVIQSGMTIGDTVAEAAPDLLAQLLQAYNRANSAAQQAEDSASGATEATTSATQAAQSANDAAEAANTAAASIANKVDFEDILEGDNISITAADGKVTISGEPGFPTGGEPGQIAIRTADGYKWADISPEGAVVYNSTEKGNVLTVDDAYPSRPSELTVYGNTVQNLWVNPSGTQNGVTVTANANGSVTLSGTATSNTWIYLRNNFILRPGSTYTFSINDTVSNGAAGFYIDIRDSDSVNLVTYYVGGGQGHKEWAEGNKRTFTVPSDAASAYFGFGVNNASASIEPGTYRVMLNEGSTAEPWCPPGLNSVGDDGSVDIVTAGKNLLDIPDTQKITGYGGPYTFTLGDDGSVTCSSTPDQRAWSYKTANVKMLLSAGTYTLSLLISEHVSGCGIRAYKSDETLITELALSDVTHVFGSFTLDAPTEVGIIYKVATAKGYPQLELGSTATAYEPPNITTTPIDLQGHTLNKLPDGTQDVLHIYGNGNVVLEKKVHREHIGVGEFILESNEYTHKNILDQSLKYRDDVQFKSSSQRNDFAPIGNADVVEGYPKVSVYSSGGGTAFRVGDGTVQTSASKQIESIEQKIGSKGIDAMWALATPLTIPLTTAYLPSLPSPNATVYVVDDTPAEIEMDYVQEFYPGVSSGTSLELPTAATEFGIEQMLYQNRNGLVYGYRMYKDADTDLEKIGDNRNIPAPTLSTPTAPGSDPYTGLGPFFYKTVNAKIKEDGTATITAVENDSKFSLTDPDGDVWILAPVIYERWVETDDYVEHYISDTPLVGYKPQPGAYLPDGSLRPYMLYAKYHLSVDDTNTARSVSGAAPKNFVSHNSLIDICKNATTGYSAYGVADDWYIKTMFYMKYGTKNSQSIFQGCTSYLYQYKNLVAEESTNRVIITKAQAANLVVGSNMEIGTNTSGSASTDRGNATAYDIADHATITKIEDYDSSNSAVYFENIESFTTTTNTLISTISWNSGTCDGIVGDGTPVLNNAKYPYVMQGIELATGLYVVMGNVILRNSGSGWKAYINWDSQNEKTDYDEDFYEDTGLILPTDAANDSWKYPLWAKSYKGLISSNNTGGSSTTGMCDGIYTNKLSTQGTREWQSFGNLGHGSIAGVACVVGSAALSSAWWSVASRLSAHGRSKG